MDLPAADTQQRAFSVTASAPGKVILAGEYSVLFGWPAIVFAVDRLFVVTIEQARLGAKGIRAELIGLELSPQNLSVDEQGNVGCPSDSPLRMFRDIFNTLGEYYGLKPLFLASSWKITLDSSALFDQGDKLGLGSSAALTVSLDQAMRQLSQSDIASAMNIPKPRDFDGGAQDQAETRWLRLHQLHSKVQGKQGSGVDIAASLSGICCAFVNESHQGCKIRSLELPRTLHIRFIWSGQSASTPAYLQSLSHWKLDNSELFEQHMNALGSASTELVAALEAKLVSVETVVLLLRAFTESLFRFDSASQIGIFSENHAYLYEKSQAYSSMVYKPCGAGGGDIGIAVGFDGKALDKFCSDIEARSMRVIEMKAL